MIDTLIFDLDDTLIECGVFYKEVREQFIGFQNSRTDLPHDFIEKMVQDIDLHCTTLPNGFSRLRIPRSFAATSAALDIIRGKPVDTWATEVSFNIANAVFDAAYPFFEGAEDRLNQYYLKGFELILITKGDEQVQKKKILMHQLTRWFHLSDIHIVPKKNADVLTKILESYSIPLSQIAYVGDSLRDDIGPANEVGITSVWVSNEDTPRWNYENIEHTPTHIINHIKELPNVIPY